MSAEAVRFWQIADYIKANQPEENIVIKGWVRTRREGKEVSFLEINDGSQLKNLQVVLEGALNQSPLLKQAQTGAAVKLTGDLAASPGHKQKWEFKARDLEIIGSAGDGDYPLQKKRHTDEFLRAIAHLRARTNKYGALFRLRSQTAQAVHDFFRQRGFFMFTPRS